MEHIEVSLHWRDIFNLIVGYGGWKQRYGLNMEYLAMMSDDSPEQKSGGVIWESGSCQLVLLSGEGNTSTVYLQVNSTVLVDSEAKETWEKLQKLFLPYKPSYERELSGLRHNELLARLEEIANTNKTNQKKQKQKSDTPILPAVYEKWKKVWDFLETKVVIEKPSLREIRFYLDTYIFDDKPGWVPGDNDTLKKIIDAGRSGKFHQAN